jgi:hypothetical protein
MKRHDFEYFLIDSHFFFLEIAMNEGCRTDLASVSLVEKNVC